MASSGTVLAMRKAATKWIAAALASAFSLSLVLAAHAGPKTINAPEPKASSAPPGAVTQGSRNVSSTRYLEAVVYLSRGEDYQKKGDLDRAIADFDKAIEFDPKLTPAYENRGFARNEKGEYDRAITDFNKAIELDPKLTLAYDNRGFARNKKGEYDRAITDFNKAIELDPKYAAPHNN